MNNEAEKSIRLERDVHKRLDRFGGSAIRMIPEELHSLARKGIRFQTEHSGKTEAVDRDVSGHSLRTELGENIPSGGSPVLRIFLQKICAEILNAAQFHTEKNPFSKCCFDHSGAFIGKPVDEISSEHGGNQT